MIALTLDIADLSMAATVAAAAALLARMHHRNAIDAAVRAKALAASKLSKTLKSARQQLESLRPLAERATELERELARTKRELQAERVDNSKLTEANEKLEDEVQDKARYVAETLIDFEFVDNALSDAVGFARTASEEELARDVLERITLAHIFDAVKHARGPLMPWAKALRIGPFKAAEPKPILDQAYDVLEAMGAFDQLGRPRSVSQQILDEQAAKPATDSAAATSRFRGGGKK